MPNLGVRCMKKLIKPDFSLVKSPSWLFRAPLPPVQIECPAQPLEHWTRAFSGIEKPWRVRLLWCLLCSRDAFGVLQPVVTKDGLGILSHPGVQTHVANALSVVCLWYPRSTEGFKQLTWGCLKIVYAQIHQKETANLCLDHRLLEVVVAKIPHAVRHENNISIERAKVFQECLAADVQNESLYNLLTTQYIIYTICILI